MAQVKYEEGGTISNAASEYTLQKLLDTMQGMGGPAAGAATAGLASNAKDQLKNSKNQSKADKAGTKAKKEDTKATEAGTKATKSYTKAVAAAALAAAGSLVGSIAGMMTGVGSELMQGQTQLSGFTKHIAGNLPAFKALGEGAQALLAGFEGHMETFRDMANIGATTGNNLMQFTLSAAKAGISVDMLTGIVKENAAGFALASGSVAGGVKTYTTFLDQLRKKHGNAYDKMGLRTEEQAEIAAEYFAMEARRSRGKLVIDDKLIKQANSYVTELDRLTKLTGMSRKEAAKALAEKQKDPIMDALYRTMATGSRNFAEGQSVMLEKAPALQAMFDQIVTSGVALTDGARETAALNPLFKKYADFVHVHTKGGREMTESQKNEALKLRDAAALSAKTKLKSDGAFYATTLHQGKTFGQGMVELAGLNDMLAESTKKVNDELTNQKTGGAKALTMQTELMKLAMQMQKVMADKVMPQVEKAFNGVTDYLRNNGKKHIDDAVKFVEDQLKKIGNLIDGGLPDAKKLLKEGYQKVKDSFTDIATNIGTGWDNLGQTNKYKEANKRLLEIAAEQAAIETAIGNGTLTEAQLATAQKRLAELKGEAMEVNAVLTAEKKDVSNLDKLAAFFDGINWGAVTIGLAAAGAAFLVIKGALFLGTLALAGLGALSGFLLMGTAVIVGIAAAIWLVSDSIGGIATGLKAMSEVKVDDNMKSMPGFLGDLAGPLTKLSLGGIVAQLGGGGLKKLADGVKEFQDIQVDNLAKTGPALEALYKGVSAFTGDSLLDKAGKSIASFFGMGGGTGGMKDVAEGLENFKDVDAAGLEKIGKGLEGITGFVEAMKNADLDKTSDKIEKLINNLKEYQKQTANMSGDMSANLSTTMKGVMSDSGASVDKLNSSMQTLIELVQAGNKIETKQLKALEER